MTDNAFRALRANGYENILPIAPPGVDVHDNCGFARVLAAGGDNRGKAPGVKRGSKWTGMFDWHTHVTTEEDLDRWAAMGAGAGLRMGDGLICIDVDALDEARADQIEADALAKFGPSPMRVGRWPKRALFYRIKEDVPYQVIKYTEGGRVDGIEFMCAGKQMAVAGIHPKTGKPYEWRRPLVPKDQLTQITVEQLKEFVQEQRAKLPLAQYAVKGGGGKAVDQSTLRGNPEAVAKAVRATPNNRNIFPTREDYIEMGIAIKAALPDDEPTAFELWTEWAEKDDGGHPELWAKDWKGMHGEFRIGASWLYAQAEKHCLPGEFTVADAWFDALPDQEESPFAVAEAVEAKQQAASAGRLLPTITLTEASDTALQSNSKPLVHGLLDQETLNMIYGASNTGKTFAALDMAFCIAHGLPWAGLDTESVKVLYVAAEGGPGIKKRARALKMHRYAAELASLSGGSAERFHFIPAPIDLYAPTGDLKPLLDTIDSLGSDGARVGLVVLDTLSRVLPGGKEDTQDMGVFVARATTIKTSMKCAVLVVHHSGKNEAQGARGSSVLRAAVDTEMEVKDGRISVTKQRDHEPLPDLCFTLKGVVVGQDGRGIDVTSAVVHFGQQDSPEVQKPTDTENTILEAMACYRAEHPKSNGVPPSGVKDILSRDGSEISVDGVRAHLKRLARKGLVSVSGRGIWVEKSRKSELSTLVLHPEKLAPVFKGETPSGQQSGQDVFD